MSRNKKRAKHFVSTVCHRYHFSNANTAEIIFTLLFLGVITRLIALISGEAQY